jgi:hypothetical protein
VSFWYSDANIWTYMWVRKRKFEKLTCEYLYNLCSSSCIREIKLSRMRRDNM